ncbi:MAG: LCP family protein [Clostridia bacterium]|nr:LCP family protein [Clostridia bacterium]
MHIRRRSQRIILILLSILILIALVLVGIGIRNTSQVQQRGTMSEGFGQRETVEIDGQIYGRKWNVETFLLMGIDKQNDRQQGFRDGGQADSLLVIVLDHDSKKVNILQLDRNTMAMITVLGIVGDDVGLREWQICLAHAYGATREENNRHAVEAVQRLLNNITIDGYATMKLADIAKLNHALGGVTVTLEDDFTDYDPLMYVGATLKLTDDQAAEYLHERMNVADGTNTNRMRRHRAYLSGAIQIVRERTSKEKEFINSFVDDLREITFTDLAYGRIINELNRAYKYTIEPIETLDGYSDMSPGGYARFYADQKSIDEWVTSHYYEPI